MTSLPRITSKIEVALKLFVPFTYNKLQAMILEYKHPSPKHEYAQLITKPDPTLDLHNFFLVVQSILTVSSKVNIS